MNNKLTLIYWETEDGLWRGKLAEFPNLFAEGETLKELEDNIYDEYEAMVLDGVGDYFEVKEILG